MCICVYKLSNIACLTHVFFKRGEECSALSCSLSQKHGGKHGGKIKALLKRSLVLTKPLILGIGASKVLPIDTANNAQHNNPIYIYIYI